MPILTQLILVALGVLLVGVEPSKEAGVTIFDDRIIEGEYLSEKGKLECAIGEQMAKNLGLKPGSKMVLLTQGYDGSTGALKFRVKGIFRTGSMEIDRSMVLICLDDARNLLMAPDMVNSIAIMTTSPKEVDKTVAALRSKLSGKKLEVPGWKKLMPDLVQFVTLDSMSGYLFLGLLLIVVVFGVLSSVFSSILERTKELGIMLALGTKPRQVVLMVMMEALCLTIVGLSIGLAVGLGRVYVGR